MIAVHAGLVICTALCVATADAAARDGRFVVAGLGYKLAIIAFGILVLC
jgi:hypothetical protein